MASRYASPAARKPGRLGRPDVGALGGEAGDHIGMIGSELPAEHEAFLEVGRRSLVERLAGGRLVSPMVSAKPVIDLRLLVLRPREEGARLIGHGVDGGLRDMMPGDVEEAGVERGAPDRRRNSLTRLPILAEACREIDHRDHTGHLRRLVPDHAEPPRMLREGDAGGRALWRLLLPAAASMYINRLLTRWLGALSEL